MQSEKVELEEVELTESKTSEKKEYEKILIRERNRKLNVKAQNLIKLGCFNQTEEVKVDFSKLEKCTYEKPFKKFYELYKNEEDNLFYIYGKTEGENLVPYAYDVIAVESVTDEEYKALYNASKFEGLGWIKVVNIASFVILGLLAIILIINVISNIVDGASFIDLLTNLFTPFTYIAGLACIIAILNITLKKYLGK